VLAFEPFYNTESNICGYGEPTLEDLLRVIHILGRMLALLANIRDKLFLVNEKKDL